MIVLIYNDLDYIFMIFDFCFCFQWEKVLKCDVCKGIVYIENLIKDMCIVKGDNFVNQILIGLWE